MNYAIAKSFVEYQAKRLKSANMRTFIIGDYEYQLRMSGSAFCPVCQIMRREKGKRNYKYYLSFEATHFHSGEGVVNHSMYLVRSRM